MQATKKYIALLLLWTFVFPVVYQSVHTLFHHSCHGIECNNLAETSTNYFSIHSKYEDKCPICEYKFSVNQVPLIHQASQSFFFFAELIFDRLTPYYNPAPTGINIPRAPPFKA